MFVECVRSDRKRLGRVLARKNAEKGVLALGMICVFANTA